MNKTELQTEIARRKEADFAYLLLSDEQIEREILEEQEDVQQKAGQLDKNKTWEANAKISHDWFQSWYQKLGFAINIPFPPVSDKEFNRRKALGQALFYRPPTSEVSHEVLMSALGQGEHWTVADKGDRKKAVWEPAQIGYWYWAEVAESCPRLGTPWNDLTKKAELNLLSLEEYVIVWWATKAKTNTLLDVHTWSWLRTRFGQGALDAGEYSGRVCVRRWDESTLADSYGSAGGRVAEVVQT